MSNVFVDGFATYGVGSGIPTNVGNPVAQALLAGRYAALWPLGSTFGLGVLPWAPSDPDIYFSAPLKGTDHQYDGLRLALPATTTTVVVSAYVALDSLPTVGGAELLVFSDGSNNPLCALAVTTTGAMILHIIDYSQAHPNSIIASTSGPVMTAQSAAHIECKLVCGTNNSNTFTLQVNGAAVITATALPMSWDPTQTYPHNNTNPCAQITFNGDSAVLGSVSASSLYIGNLIVRDANGGVNNDITGDRRVATLFVNADDPLHQGWTGQPLRRFGAGILDLTNNATSGNYNTGVAVATPTTSLDIGAAQFTIEGNFRFQGLPSGSSKAVLYSHWDEPHNKRAVELYVGGPSLEGGNLVFRISTDGTGGTITEVISWPVQFIVGHYYHIAVARDGSNNTRLFINGVIQGVPVADAHTYFSGGASGASPAIGADQNAGVGGVAGTGFDGWVDEFRLTIGYCRYPANFTPPVAAFPRGGGDPQWADVAWISGFDAGTIVDESSYARALTAQNGAVAVLPTDGDFNFETLNKSGPPYDNSFIEAALIAASQILTYTAAPIANDTITVGTKDGTVPAVYTWKTTLTGASFEVLRDPSISVSLANLVAAINAGAGAGTTYGTGTTANFNVGATPLSTMELVATALVPGAAGNAVACSSTDPGGTWGATTLAGGQDIPAYSQFGYARLPSNATLADSITILSRSWKTDAGGCVVQQSFVGGSGGVAAGASVSVATAPNFHTDLIETDPDTSAHITPTTVYQGKIRVNRTS